MSIFKKIKRFLRARDGVAAMEFAINLPLLITMCFGSFEVARYLIINQKADKVAYSLADVVSQTTSSNLSRTQLNQMMTAAAQIMNPYTFGSNGYAIVSSVSKTGTNPPVVRWNHAGGGTMVSTSRIGTVNGTATIPGSITLNDKDNIIIVEVYYRYAPVLGGGFVAPQTFYRTAVYKPRLGALTTTPI